MAATAIAEASETGASPVEPWAHLLDLVCEVTVDLAVPGFKIGDLLQLGEGSIINSKWKISSDVPLRVNGGLVAWCEFEVVVDRLAARITELA